MTEEDFWEALAGLVSSNFAAVVSDGVPEMMCEGLGPLEVSLDPKEPCVSGIAWMLRCNAKSSEMPVEWDYELYLAKAHLRGRKILWDEVLALAIGSSWLVIDAGAKRMRFNFR